LLSVLPRHVSVF